MVSYSKFQMIIFFALILIISISKIELVIVFTRHGARSQLFSDQFPITESKHKADGELNEIGLRQSYILGVELYNRYSDIFTDKNNIADETLFAFGAKNRLLQTGYSIMDGLYHYINPPELSRKEMENALPPFKLEKEFLDKLNNNSNDSYKKLPSYLKINLKHFYLSENLDHQNNEAFFGFEKCKSGHQIRKLEGAKLQNKKALNDFLMKLENPYFKNKTNLNLFNLYQIDDNHNTAKYNDENPIINFSKKDIETLEQAALYNYLNIVIGNNKTNTQIQSYFLINSIYNLINETVYSPQNKTKIKMAIFTVSDVNIMDLLFLFDQFSVLKSPVEFSSSIIIEYSIDTSQSSDVIPGTGRKIPKGYISVKYNENTIFPFNQKNSKIIPELFLTSLKKLQLKNKSEYMSACFEDKKIESPVLEESNFESLEEICLKHQQVIFTILSNSMHKRGEINNASKVIVGFLLIAVVIFFFRRRFCLF